MTGGVADWFGERHVGNYSWGAEWMVQGATGPYLPVLIGEAR